MQTFCPILPPLQNEHTHNCTHQVNVPMANNDHHLHHQLHHINSQMHYSTNPSFQNSATTQQITQQPRQSVHHSKTPVEKAKAAIARLERNSTASPNSSIFQNVAQTATTMHYHN